MSDITVRQRVRALAGTSAAAMLLASCPTAVAGQYTVASCDSAAAYGYNTTAWVPFANAGTAYEACPTYGSATAGVSNRLTQGTYGGFSHSGHAFTAPPGATITGFRWAGRMSRDNCRWGVYFRALPSDAPVLGMPHGQFCTSLVFDNRGWPIPEPVPAGTTRLEQLVFCGAIQCPPPAVFHTHVIEVTIDDPVPPNISLSGPLASGKWVSGTAGHFPDVSVAVVDNTGVQRIETGLERPGLSRTYACNWSTPQPCPHDANMVSTLDVASLS